jgi:hypothetical protein
MPKELTSRTKSSMVRRIFLGHPCALLEEMPMKTPELESPNVLTMFITSLLSISSEKTGWIVLIIRNSQDVGNNLVLAKLLLMLHRS